MNGAARRGTARRDRGAALEGARPVPEAAVGVRQLNGRVQQPVVGAHGDDRLGDLLAVGADVLDGRGTGQARDARQALKPAQSLPYAELDQRAPVLARRDGHGGTLAAICDIYAAEWQVAHRYGTH